MENIAIFMLEFRPQLQSCNIFIKFKTALCKSTKISLKANEISISSIYYSVEIPITNFKMVPNSLSSLEVKDNYLYFRVITENLTKELGQFKREILLNNSENTIKTYPNKSLLKENERYIISCSNCERELSNVLSFNRILPLPSDNADPSEWFCHKHEGSDYNFAPDVTDCFYSHCYTHLNFYNIKNIILSNDALVCKTCFFWLGTRFKSCTLKLWFNSVKFKMDNATTISTNSESDFILTVKKCINDSFMGFCKFILECRNINNTDYLSLWVLERDLKLIVKSANGIFNETQVAKVLFKYNQEKTEQLTNWMQDVKVNEIEISKQMMTSGLNHLQNMSELIPENYKMSNNFFVSYIKLSSL